jgi:hypothetical protein
VIISSIKNKKDLVKFLSHRETTFVDEYEVVNDSGLKTATDRAKTLLRNQRKLHIVIIERT